MIPLSYYLLGALASAIAVIGVLAGQRSRMISRVKREAKAEL